jgi:CAAX prenyl protease-like protein
MTDSEGTGGGAEPAMTVTERGPAAPGRIAAAIAAAVPLALLFAAALVAPLRPSVLMAVAIGWLVLQWRSPRNAAAWAAVLPVAAILGWSRVAGRDVPLGAAGCINPLSALAIDRVVEASAVLAIVAALAILLRVRPADIGLRGADHGILAAGIVVGLLTAVGGLVIGPLLAAPFFGQVSFAIPAAAILPALIFAVPNGVMEEVAYRGWLQNQLRPYVGWGGAIVLHVAQLAAAGIVAGLLARRFGLLPVIAVHVGADAALYYGLACSAVRA